jgi:hypothetical protein
VNLAEVPAPLPLLPLDAQDGRLRASRCATPPTRRPSGDPHLDRPGPDPVVGGRPTILEGIERLYGAARPVQKIIEDMGGGGIEVLAGPAEEDADHLRDLASEAPVIRSSTC